MNPLSLWCPLGEAFYTALADNSYFVSFELTLALLCLKINAFQFMEDDCQVLSLNQSFARRAASPFDAVCSGIMFSGLTVAFTFHAVSTTFYADACFWAICHVIVSKPNRPCPNCNLYPLL